MLPNNLLSPFALLTLWSPHFGETSWVKVVISENQEAEFTSRDGYNSQWISQNFPRVKKINVGAHNPLVLVSLFGTS